MVTMTSCWIPEALPRHPGVYANDTDPPRGKLNRRKPLITSIADRALKFATREECQKWCDENPDPPFVPAEHGFG